MTACGGNYIGGEIIRNEQCPLCGLATFEDAVLGAVQATKDLGFLFEKRMKQCGIPSHGQGFRTVFYASVFSVHSANSISKTLIRG